MSIDIPAASEFMTSQARVLDRRRFDWRRGSADAAALLAALDAYRNPDGGYGWGLEPDLRSPESQPAAAHHAFEVFAEVAPVIAPAAASLCDWLDSVTHEDGGLPFALPLRTAAGSGPWWIAADPEESSLQITSIVAAKAHRVAAHDPAVASHRWLQRATRYCLGEIGKLDESVFAYVLSFSLQFLDAVQGEYPDEVATLVSRLSKLVPSDGRLRVRGGAEDEGLHPLDLAPNPGHLARRLFSDEVIAADLERLAALQQEDGGWVVDFHSASPAAALEWRGYATVKALDIFDPMASGMSFSPGSRPRPTRVGP
jgi:hypothetical protein